MGNALMFEPAADGLVVRMGGDPPPPVSEWTARGEASSGAGPLIRLRDDAGAVECDGGRSLTVAWPSVVGLTLDELRLVGLPDVVPFALEVVATGAIHDAHFEIHYGFVNAGRRVVGVRREGAWVRAGHNDFLLLDPLYSIAECRRARKTDGFSRPVRACVPSAVFVDVLRKKRMMAVVAVRNRVCAVLQTAVGAAVCVHSSGGVHSLRAGVAGGGSLG